MPPLNCRAPDQPDSILFVRKDPNHSFSSSELILLVAPGRSCSEPHPIHPRYGQNRKRFLKSFIETIHRLGSRLRKVVEDLVLEVSGFFFSVCPERPSQGQFQGPSLGYRRMTQNIPKKMNLTALPSDPLKMFLVFFLGVLTLKRQVQISGTKW